MKGLPHLLLSIALIVVGGVLLVVGSVKGQGTGVLLGAGLAMVAGVLSLLLQRGVIGQRSGLIIGIVLCVLALGLAYFNYQNARSALLPHQMDRSISHRA